MHEFVILVVDFKFSNIVPTSEGKEGLKVLGNKVQKKRAGKMEAI